MSWSCTLMYKTKIGVRDPPPCPEFGVQVSSLRSVYHALKCPQLSRGERVTESAKSHFRLSDHSYRSKLARVAPQAGSNPYSNQRPSRGQSNDSQLPKWASTPGTRGPPNPDFGDAQLHAIDLIRPLSFDPSLAHPRASSHLLACRKVAF